MAQYLAIKAQYPDALLFYRMGDFYELFFDDAVVAARALDIALTRRGKHDGEDIQMCGVPVHAADAYLSRLIRTGHKVAVCEQMEDPAEARKRGSKSVVRRDVVRLVTPGTLTEDTLLDARAANHLAALARAEGRLALAWTDISTGELSVEMTDVAALPAAFARLRPSELLIPDSLLRQDDLAAAFREQPAALTPLPAVRFDSQGGERRLKALFRVTTLDSFGEFQRAEIAALGALIEYVELTQRGKLPLLQRPRRIGQGQHMAIDPATRRNLELVETLSGERRGSLLSTIDRTLTGAGARLLGERLSAPLTDPVAIGARLDMVESLVIDTDLRARMRDAIGRCPDLERALTRLSLGRGGPRDLAAVQGGLARAGELRDAIGNAAALPPQGARAAAEALSGHGELVQHLAEALAPEPPVLLRDGGFVAAGFRPELDELRDLRDESRRHIAALQIKYADVTGIAGLKIRHNNVLGYFIETTPKQAERIGDGFIHRQTTASAVRYSTVELGELEGRIAQAAERALALELRIFEELVARVLARAAAILAAARAIAEFDVAAALAERALEGRWVRPTVDGSLAFDVKAGRHPVVEAALARDAGPAFVPNDCDLGPGQRLWLLTGPNMAGKSTFLRQQALIAILAQMGSFVPADAAHVGAVDRLFSRVGAADDLARGRSTFMVEMVETATILNQAGPRSLVILDEIGRGTATYDGLSIAWAAVEHLHELNRSRALFATHYHELTALAQRLSDVANRTMRVKEWQGDVIFLHEVAPGAADRSYGIQVAKLAGLPESVVARAQEILQRLEQAEGGDAVAQLTDDLPLFRAHARSAPHTGAIASAVEAALRELHPDQLTPREALDQIYRLRDLLDRGNR